MKTGKIKNIKFSMGSGVQTIVFEGGENVLIENYGLRQLENAFENPIGKTIEYDIENGLMIGFDKIDTFGKCFR